MKFRLSASALSAAFALAFGASAQAPAAAPAAPQAAPAAVTIPAAPDYRRPSDWLCRPGQNAACAIDLNAVGVAANGSRRPVRFQAAADPQIDCFYVYPTVSLDAGPLSDLQPGAEEQRAVRAQFARLASRCRLFAPMYRQVTLAGLQMNLRAGGMAPGVEWNLPYEDVRAAFRDYMARDNNGRGFVLLGHSQGSLMLERLLREEIDGKPAQGQMVAAYLAGHLAFLVPQGRDAGGSLPTIPLCRTNTQFGCVLAWSTYRTEDTSSPRFFAASRQPGMIAACVNPAAPAGGRATLRGFFSRPAGAPESDPPWVENVSGISGECVFDAQGGVLRVSADPGTVVAPILAPALQRAETLPGWGTHIIDVSLVMGDIVELIGRQAEAWRASQQGSASR